MKSQPQLKEGKEEGVRYRDKNEQGRGKKHGQCSLEGLAEQLGGEGRSVYAEGGAGITSRTT